MDCAHGDIDCTGNMPRLRTIALSATATGGGGTVTKVEYYNGGILIGTRSSATAPTYSFNWTNVPAGTYTLTAKVYNSLGATAVSAPKTVTVTILPPVYVPTVGYFTTLQLGYASAPASSDILAQAMDITGNYVANLGKNIRLRGGYDGNFLTRTGYTTMIGNLTVGTGSLTVEYLIIK